MAALQKTGLLFDFRFWPNHAYHVNPVDVGKADTILNVNKLFAVFSKQRVDTQNTNAGFPRRF